MLRRQWNLPMVAALARYHRRHPPLHRLVAAFVGYTPPVLAADETADPDAVVFAAKNLREGLPPHLRAAADAFLKAAPMPDPVP